MHARVSATLLLRIAIGLTVLALVFLGLTPFSFAPPNDAHWERGAPAALVFSGRGLAYSEGTFGRDQFGKGEIRIELSLEPELEPHGAVGAILAIEDGQKPEALLVAQWRRSLIVRVRDHSRWGRDYWEISSEPRLLAQRRHRIQITYRRGRGTSLEIDGHSRLHRTPPLLGPGVGTGSRLLLGCRQNGSAGWSGRLLGLALYERASAEPEADRGSGQRSLARAPSRFPGEVAAAVYDFSERPNGRVPDRVRDQAAPNSLGDLRVPRVFSPLTPDFLSLPTRRSLRQPWFLRDLLQNFLGFVPLGLLVLLLRARESPQSSAARGFSAATATGVALSFAIEALQVALPDRSSSLLDWLLNSAGAAMGALLGLAIVWVRRSRKSR